MQLECRVARADQVRRELFQQRRFVSQRGPTGRGSKTRRERCWVTQGSAVFGGRGCQLEAGQRGGALSKQADSAAQSSQMGEDAWAIV